MSTRLRSSAKRTGKDTKKANLHLQKEIRKAKRSQLEMLFAHQLRCSEIVKRWAGPWEQEYRFHKVRRWRFDFAWPQLHFAVEIDGGTWNGGRHVTGAGFQADAEKMNSAVLEGWFVMRFTGTQVRSGYALQTVERVFESSRRAELSCIL